MERRVVITGAGIISPVGQDTARFWEALKAGECGISTLDCFPEYNLSIKVAGLVRDFDPTAHGMTLKDSKRNDLYSQYALAAADEAVRMSGLESGVNIEPDRFGVYIGSGIGGMETFIEQTRVLDGQGADRISPLFIPKMISNIAGGNIAIRYNAQGPCLTVVSACATGTNAIGEAFRAIRHGYSDAIIAGGAEAVINPLAIGGFANCKALTRQEDPKHASLPFNLNRGGFVMADGAAVLILEEWEHAKQRGAHIYAEMVGYGSTCDAYHATAPRPDGSTQAECIRIALEQALFDPQKDNMYINAHGTGTKLNDIAETTAYKLALGDYAYKAHISSTKSMHGHMFGATGAAEAIATVLALQEGIVPPTINLDTPDPECDLDYTPNTAVKADLTIGISDSFGFGGHNACIAFRKAE